MDGLEDLGKLIYGLDSEFSGGSGCGIDNFGIFGVSGWFKDYGDAGIPAEGGTEGRDAGIPTEDGTEGCVSDQFGDVGVPAKSETKGSITFQKFS